MLSLYGQAFKLAWIWKCWQPFINSWILGKELHSLKCTPGNCCFDKASHADNFFFFVFNKNYLSAIGDSPLHDTISSQAAEKPTLIFYSGRLCIWAMTYNRIKVRSHKFLFGLRVGQVFLPLDMVLMLHQYCLGSESAFRKEEKKNPLTDSV